MVVFADIEATEGSMADAMNASVLMIGFADIVTN